MAWNDLASNECPTKADIEGVFARFVPGMIIAFKGSSIPSGWALCDGANGTPNLIGKFIRGGSTFTAGNTGGKDNVTLTSSNLPSHSHSAGSLYTNSAGSHTHNCYQPRAGKSDNANDRTVMEFSDYKATSSSGSHSHSIYGNTGSTGSGSSFSILPPYYTLVYIMKL